MNRKVKQTLSKITAGMLSAAMCITFVPKIIGNDVVSAAVTKTNTNTCLGTSGIASPKAPKYQKTPWSGSYVIFGKNYSNQQPIRFRVLAPSTSEYGGTTMFLDSEETLFRSRFDSKSRAWTNSEMRKELNSTFYEESFSDIEKSAIAKSYSEGGKLYPSGSFERKMFGRTTGVNDKIFLLDVSEVLNTAYGYSSDNGYEKRDDVWVPCHSVLNRQKNGESSSWWLRSAYSATEEGAGYVEEDGVLFCNRGTKYEAIANTGVAPALNINTKSVIFSTAISGNLGGVDSEYKLTLKDSNLKVAVQSGQKTKLIGDKKISVPYTISGSDAGNATRASVLILDKAYTEGNTNSAKILYYGALGGTFGKTATGTFSLPSSLDMSGWGSKYHVYILAEDVNRDTESDYASVPVEISVPQYKNLWLQEGNVWHYYNNSGVKVTGWFKIKEEWYLFNSKGDMLKGWQKNGSSWYYLGGNGTMRTQWQIIDGKWYYFGGNGVMRTGWEQVGEYWYYFGDSGVMRTGWQQIGENWFYFESDGKMATGWKWLSDSYFFFNSNGIMVANEWYDGYYLSDSGAMATGWQQIGDDWFYFESDGTMVTGWKWISDAYYFFKPSGIMASDEWYDGYYLDPDGRWTWKHKCSWDMDLTCWWYGDGYSWYAKNQTIKINDAYYTFNASGYCTNV